MKKYQLFKVHLNKKKIVDNIKDVLDSGFINEGEQVVKLTKHFQDKFERQSLIVVNSCTSALTLSLEMLNLTNENEVITTSMTCVATNCPIKTSNAKLIWADIDKETGCLSAESIRTKITTNTKAVMLVLWAGIVPYDFEEIVKICNEHNIYLIIDAAHGMLAKHKNKFVHEFADFTCYSLQAIKHITSGDGGLLVMCNKGQTFYERSKKLKWFGIDRDQAKDDKGNWKGQNWDYDITECGYKFNMNNISAAICLSQFEEKSNVDTIVSSHRRNASLYDKLFVKHEKIKPLRCHPDSESAFWVYTVLLSSSKYTRDEIMNKLNAIGIMAALVHTPNHLYSAFNEEYVELDNVNQFYSTQLSLPCGWWLTQKDIKFIANKLIEIVNEI